MYFIYNESLGIYGGGPYKSFKAAKNEAVKINKLLNHWSAQIKHKYVVKILKFKTERK